MDWIGEVEADAANIYREADFDPCEPRGIGRLVDGILHSKPQYEANMLRESAIAKVKGVWTIYVRKGIAARRARWLVAHELAHYWLKKIGCVDREVEQRCDALGAALVAPRPAFRAVRRMLGGDSKELADAFATTQSLIMLRRGECEGIPVAVVGARVIVRGDDFGWPGEAELRRIARAGRPEVVRVVLADEGRVALLAA